MISLNLNQLKTFSLYLSKREDDGVPGKSHDASVSRFLTAIFQSVRHPQIPFLASVGLL